MPDPNPLAALVRRISPGYSDVPDVELLDRFVQSADQAAFELLVWRHGAMVWGVCRRILGPDRDAAEDACQAVFVALARHAARLGGRRAVAAWLPTFSGRSHPLLVRDPYLRRHRQQLGTDDLALRLVMTDFVSGLAKGQEAERLFVAGLERYAVSGVLLAVTPDTARAREALRIAGFEKALATLEYEIWVRR